MNSAYLIVSKKNKYIAVGIFSGIMIGILGAVESKTAIVAVSIFVCCAFFMLMNVKFNLFVLLDVFLLSAVMFEPAPSDILFCILLVLGILNKTLTVGKLKNISFILLLYVVYFLLSFVGIAGASDIYRAVRYYAITFYLFLFAVFIFLYTSSHNYVSLIRTYVLGSSFSALAGIAGYMGFFSDIFMADSYRVRSLFKDPNVFGPFLVPAIIIILDDLKTRKILRTNPVVHISFAALNILALVLSFSRAAWINLLVAVLVYFIMNFKGLQLFKLSAYAVVIALATASFWLYIADDGLKDFIWERARIQEYDKNRFASQKAGLDLLVENPTGYGPGQFELKVVQLTKMRLSAHNLYIRVIMENGVIGFITFFTAILCILVKLFMLGEGGSNNRLKNSVLISIMIGILVNSLVIDTLHWRHFWFFIGLCLFNMCNVGRMSEVGSE